jgi:hypothetical protein
MAHASDYQLFGLRIRSEIELPELFPFDGEGEANVTIRWGSVAAGPVERPFDYEGEAIALSIGGVARFRIEDGSTILVDPAPGVPERNIRLFLLGSAFGALLHQRGLLPLHANAIEIDGKSVAFMGESGAGKSTLAAWFHDHGHRIIADDVCVVRFRTGGQAVTPPGLPRLRLWHDALKAMGREESNFQRSYAGDNDSNKFDVPVAREAAATAEADLSAIYLLEKADALEISRIDGLAAAEAVFANTYRGIYINAVKGEHRHWSSCVTLVRNTPIYRLRRRWGLDHMEEQCRRLVEHAKEAAENPIGG